MKTTVKKNQIIFDFGDYEELLTFVRALNIAFTYCCWKCDSKCETCPLSKVMDENGTDLCTNVDSMLYIRP